MEMKLPAIRYKQGSRTHYATAGSAPALVKLCEAPRLYDPQKRHEPGNRPLDKNHLQGIVRYLETEPDFVIGSVTLYVRKGTVRFQALDDEAADSPALGWAFIPIDARFSIGDGQHRLRAYERVIGSHEEHDPLLENIRRSGSPAIIVEEDDPAKIAQDFVDLQRNAKPLSSSLGAAMDRRLAINSVALELARSLDVFRGEAPGDRIEYLSQTLSKLAPRAYTFASWRWAVGTILIGFGQRTRRKWEQATEEALNPSELSRWKSTLSEVFTAATKTLPGWKDLAAGEISVPAFRETYVLGSAAGLNAFAGAMHEVLSQGLDWQGAVQRMAALNWLKVAADEEQVPFFEGTILQDGHVLNTRPSFEAAAKKLFKAAATQRAA